MTRVGVTMIRVAAAMIKVGVTMIRVAAAMIRVGVASKKPLVVTRRSIQMKMPKNCCQT